MIVIPTEVEPIVKMTSLKKLPRSCHPRYCPYSFEQYKGVYECKLQHFKVSQRVENFELAKFSKLGCPLKEVEE